ncbi:MAG: hypothetical protein AB7H80_01840 [Candidatus Kapaibacterium sp.]
MNEQLHNILDGDFSAHSREQLFSGPEEEQEFRELRALTEELRHNADHSGLTSSERVAIGAGVAAALGFQPVPTIAAGTVGGTSSSSGWILKSIATLLLGIVIGVGGFALYDRGGSDKEDIKTVGVQVHSTTPTFFPFAVPEPSAGAACDSLVTQLQDSLRTLQQGDQGTTKARKPKKKKWRNPYEPPVTGVKP